MNTNELPMELAEQLFPLAIEFDLGPIPVVSGKLTSDFPENCGFGGRYNATLRYRGIYGWAIMESSSCLSKKENDFIYESMPSNRTDDFLEDTRFKDVKEALAFYEQWKRKELDEFHNQTGKYELLKNRRNKKK